MGNRINKAIGWTVPCSQDPVDRESDRATAPLPVYAAWLTQTQTSATSPDEKILLECEAAMLTFNADPRSCVGDSVIWTEHLDGGTLILTPPFLGRSWHRADDPIDHAFADGQASNSLDFSDWGFYPYEGLWMDAVTGIPLNQFATHFRRAAARDNVGDDALDLLATAVGPHGGQAPGPYKSRHEALSGIVPVVPPEIRWLAEYLGLFQDQAEVLKLRPARAQWWG
jgi:hypothetical protein